MSVVIKNNVEKKINELKEKLIEIKNKPLLEFKTLLGDDFYLQNACLSDHKSIIHVKPLSLEERRRYEITGLEEKIETLNKIFAKGLVVSEDEIAKKKDEITSLQEEIYLIQEVLPIFK